MSRANDMTVGKVTPMILNFFFPLLATYMLQQAYSVADTIIVGKGLGDNALAAVGNMGSLTFLIIGFSSGLCAGFSVIIAQKYGAKLWDELRNTVASTLTLAAGIIVLLTALSVAYLPDILTIMRTPEEIRSESLQYGFILFGGLFATVTYNLFAGMLRALGNSFVPLIAIIISSVLNIVLDLVFIFLLHLGVIGAASATILAQIVSAAICFSYLRKIKEIQVRRSDFQPRFRIYFSLLTNGIPMGLMNSVTAIGAMVVQYFVNGMGVAFTTAYAACSKYINMFMQPACAAGHTMSNFTSQNYGAGKFSRIRSGLRVCLMIALITYVLLGSIMILFPGVLAGIMVNGKETTALMMQFLPICGALIFAVDFLFVFRSGVQGMGYPLIPMISGILEMVLRIAVIVLFVSDLGFRATAFAEASAWMGALLLNLTAYFILFHIKSRQEILKIANEKANSDNRSHYDIDFIDHLCYNKLGTKDLDKGAENIAESMVFAAQIPQ